MAKTKKKLGQTNLETEMDNKRGGSKSPDDSDKDEDIGMNDVQRKTPSPHNQARLRKLLLFQRKPPLVSVSLLQIMTATTVPRMMIQARQNPKVKPTQTTRLNTLTKERTGITFLNCVS